MLCLRALLPLHPLYHGRDRACPSVAPTDHLFLASTTQPLTSQTHPLVFDNRRPLPLYFVLWYTTVTMILYF